MKTDTSNRLKQIMSERNLKQVDILNLSLPYQKKYGIKLGKSTLSQYVNGIQSPDQNRIYLLAQTLGVSEAWLMGFDVPMFEGDSPELSMPIIKEITDISAKLEEPRQEIVLDTAKTQLEQQKQFEKERAEKLIPFFNEHSLVDKRSLEEAIEEAEQVDESRVDWNEWVSFDGKPITDEVKAAMKLILGKRLED